MPYSVTLHVVVADKPHRGSKSKLDRLGLYHRGDVVNVYRPQVTEAPRQDGELAFVHVNGIPDAVSWPRLRRRLLAQYLNPDHDDDDDTTDPALKPIRMLRRRRNRLVLRDLPARRRAELNNQHETSIAWATFLGAFARLAVDAGDKYDDELDDEAARVVETDFDQDPGREGA